MEGERNMENCERFFLELRFWNSKLSRQIVECLAQHFAVTLIQSRISGGDTWVRLEMLGDVRRIDSLRRLGREYGFHVGTPSRAAA
jgi:hypothetical protein